MVAVEDHAEEEAQGAVVAGAMVVGMAAVMAVEVAAASATNTTNTVLARHAAPDSRVVDVGGR
jgi:hypothetical protein